MRCPFTVFAEPGAPVHFIVIGWSMKSHEEAAKLIRTDLAAIRRSVASIEKSLDEGDIVDAYGIKCLGESVGTVAYSAGQYNEVTMHRLYPEMMSR